MRLKNRAESVTIIMDHARIYGLGNVSIVALFRCIQSIANTFHLEYLNNLHDLYTILSC
jgi:hypothetical protein